MNKILFLFTLLLFITGCETASLKPTLNKGYDTVYQNELWIDEGAELIIGFRKIPMQAMNSISTQTLGTFIVTYEVTHENVLYKIKRYVQVISKQGIDVELKPGIDTISLGDTWIDEGLISVLDIHYIVLGSVDASKIGTYKIEYVITYLGNQYSIIRYVSVI
jgi:hypothetical protein